MAHIRGLREAIGAADALVTSGQTNSGLGLLTDAAVLELLTAADRVVSLAEAARAHVIREVARRQAADNEARCVPAGSPPHGAGTAGSARR